MSDLVRYDAMCTAIAECHRVDEVKDMRDKARALELYAQQAKNTDAERRACEIRLRAERRTGELLRDLARATPAEAGKVSGEVRAPNVSHAETRSPPSPYADTLARPKDEAIRTDKTVEIIDTTVRPTAKWQTQDLPPDPRYPSFSSMRPGTDPRTGKAWEGRA